jgi:misacylated tRNA(Ala) deacylase
MLLDVGLYLVDAYARTCEARVIAVEGARIALDRTVFCPGERGQRPDCGMVRWQANSAKVTHVNVAHGRCWHHIEGAVPNVGTLLTGELDWTHRQRAMRMHTALHLLSALAFHLSGAQTVASELTTNGLQLTLQGDGGPELAGEIIRHANQAIQASIPVYTYLLSREEAYQTPLLNQTTIALLPKRIRSVRVVEIEGIALDIDGGTHVRTTREIGHLRLLNSRQLPAHRWQFEARLLRDARPVRLNMPNGKSAVFMTEAEGNGLPYYH